MNSSVNYGRGLLNALFIAFFAIYVMSCVGIGNSISNSILRLYQSFFLGFLFLFLSITMFQSRQIYKIESAVFFASFYVLSYYIIGFSQAGFGNVFMQVSFFFSIVPVLYCNKFLKRRQCIYVYFIVLIILNFSIVQDILLNRVNQGLTFEELDELGSNVEWTAFSTAVLFVFGASLLVLLNSSHFVVKIIHSISLFISFYYIVFCSMRGSIIILMFLLFILLLFAKYIYIIKASIVKYLVYCVMITLVTLLVFNENVIFDWLLNISPSDRLTYRILDLKEVSTYGVSEDSLSGRYYLGKISVQTWLRDPLTFLFGIGDQRISNLGIQGFILSGVGGHSEILDTLARFGLVGFSIVVALFLRISKYLISLFDSPKVKMQVKMLLLVIVLTAFSKAIFFDIVGIGMFVLIPLTSLLINNKN